MNHFMKLSICLIASILLAGCASSEVSKRQSYAASDHIKRPSRIIVYDIGATPEDVPASSAITGHYDYWDKPQTEEEVQLGRKLGAQVADGLVREILKTGLPAERAKADAPRPQAGDILITGQFITVDEGDRKKRVLIGFGKGSGELRTHIEGYVITPEGHRLLGTRQVDTAGGKTPGLALPGIVSAATRNPVGIIAVSALNLKQEKGSETIEGAAKRTIEEVMKELTVAFKRQGWI